MNSLTIGQVLHARAEDYYVLSNVERSDYRTFTSGALFMVVNCHESEAAFAGRGLSFLGFERELQRFLVPHFGAQSVIE